MSILAIAVILRALTTPFSLSLPQNFYGECSPSGARVRNQRSRFNRWNDKRDVAYFVNKAEDDGLQVIDTAHIKGRDWAGGSAVQDPANGDIYMTGSGRDIWWWHDGKQLPATFPANAPLSLTCP